MLIQTPLLTTASVGFRLPAWFWLGAGVYVLLLVNGNGLLNDSDTYWHIAVGKWILDHNSFPRVDMYSFTKAGEPWISTSWLAQVLYAGTYEIGGWAGPTILAATCIAGTFALLAFIAGQSIRSTYAIMIALVALPVSASHFLARPHVLALPVMLAWVNGLLGASERREPPSFWAALDRFRRLCSCRLLRDVLRVGVNPRLAQNSGTRRAAESDLRMEPGGFQSLQHIRGVYIGFDSGFALSRCKAFAAANCVGAGLVSHGPFTRP